MLKILFKWHIWIEIWWECVRVRTLMREKKSVLKKVIYESTYIFQYEKCLWMSDIYIQKLMS